MLYPFERVIIQSEVTVIIIKISQAGGGDGREAYMHVYMTNGRYHTVSMLSREVRRTLRTRDGGGGTSMASVLTS